MTDADLCDFCVLPAVALVAFRVDWRDLTADDEAQACQSCAEWLEGRGLVSVQALPSRPLVAAAAPGRKRPTKGLRPRA